MKPMSPNIRAIDEIQEQKHKAGLVCPHCNSHDVVRFAKYVIKTYTGEIKRQRYRCKSCRQTFNELTSTPLQRTRRPHLWIRFIECMIEGFSLRKCAELLHNEVTHVTLFYWWHKILAALKQIPTETFQDIIEMDETYFLYSEKGKRNIFERKSRKTRWQIYISWHQQQPNMRIGRPRPSEDDFLWRSWTCAYSDYKIG